MNARLIIGLLTAGLASTLATAASAEHNHSNFGGQPSWSRDHAHYVVKYDLHGSRKLHAGSHREAHALVDALERVGAHATSSKAGSSRSGSTPA